MQETQHSFDELTFFAQVKKRPGMFLGTKSLCSLRDQLLGMAAAFFFCCDENQLKYFSSFVDWYHEKILNDENGYACWWNHILYTSGNDDAYALDSFFNCFERYLSEIHNLSLPEVK